MTTPVSLKEVLQEIIVDFHRVTVGGGIPRHLEITPMEGKAMICMGVRRCGKSTFMGQIMQKLLTQSGPDRVSHTNIVSINFFDDRLHALGQDELGLVLEAYFSLYPEKKHVEKIYCFFDEIQVIPGWESFIDRIMRTELCEVYITGSSAHMLSKEIATQMRGRALSWEMFPFSFCEFLDFKTLDSNAPLSSKVRLLIQKAFEEYWEKGGFPEVAGTDRLLRIKIHQEYFHAILFRDLIERHDIPHPKAIMDIAYYLIDNTASLYSINKLSGFLKSLGHKLSKASVAQYLVWFEDAYVFFSIQIFDPSHARANVNPKKIYCIDHALIPSVGSGILVNSGHLLENIVFLALRRITSTIYYYRTQNNHEVDFIAVMSDRRKILIQVCESLADPKTRKREILALEEAMLERTLSSSIIVTRDEEEEIIVESGKIRVIPVWKFLLEY